MNTRFSTRRAPRTLPPSTWGLRVGPNGHLWSDDVDLVALASRHGTPVHVVDERRLAANARAALAPRAAGCGADMFVSYKTNSTAGVLRRLHAQGFGAEVISEFELWLACRLGVPPSRIVFNGPVKSPASLTRACTIGVSLINANSAHDLGAIERAAASVDRVATVGVRVGLPRTWTAQFGMRLGSTELIETIRRARSSPHLRLCGLHVHHGETMRAIAEVQSYIHDVHRCVRTLVRETGWSPSIVDLGGSLPCPTVRPYDRLQQLMPHAGRSVDAPHDASRVASVATASRLAHQMLGKRADGVARLVLWEPGRSVLSDAQLLLLSVVDVRPSDAGPIAILDGGTGIAAPMTGEYHGLFNATAPTRNPVTQRLVGPICTPTDTLCRASWLGELRIGDVVAVMDTGAYFTSFSTDFSFPRPGVVGHDGRTSHVIERAEDFVDLARRDASDGALDTRPVDPTRSVAHLTM